MTDGVREMEKDGGNIIRHILFKVVFKFNTQYCLFVCFYTFIACIFTQVIHC